MIPCVSSTHLDAVSPHINGFTAYSPTPSSIAMSWNQNTAPIDYYRVSSTNALQVLFHLVNSSVSVFYILYFSSQTYDSVI